MRLWHEDLIIKLDNKRLLGQHRECCALRGNGWGKKHSTVDYVFKHTRYKLFQYHMKVMNEMIRRGYNPDPNWMHHDYRGRNCKPEAISIEEIEKCNRALFIYTEHSDEYMQECLDNLKRKGITI